VKYTSQSVTKTTVKAFALQGAAPNKAEGAKKEFLPDTLTVTYVEGSDGLKRINWKIRGPVLLKDGKAGVNRAESAGHFLASGFDEFQAIADKNAPWVKA
jgi:hypothetical protein